MVRIHFKGFVCKFLHLGQILLLTILVPHTVVVVRYATVQLHICILVVELVLGKNIDFENKEL